MSDLLEEAWLLLANASGGNWDHPDNVPGWKAAAERWRDEYDKSLGRVGQPPHQPEDR